MSNAPNVLLISRGASKALARIDSNPSPRGLAVDLLQALIAEDGLAKLLLTRLRIDDVEMESVLSTIPGEICPHISQEQIENQAMTFYARYKAHAVDTLLLLISVVSLVPPEFNLYLKSRGLDFRNMLDETEVIYRWSSEVG